jgi:hypothetical protein
MKLNKNITKIIFLCLVLVLGFSGNIFSQPPPPEPGDGFGSSIIGSLIVLLSSGAVYASFYINKLKLKLFKKTV